MSNLKTLFRVSLVLLIINFLLVGVIAINHLRTNLVKKEMVKNARAEEVKGASSIPVFSPSMVISNEGFRSTRACPSPAAVQQVLNRYNSPLKNYVVQGRSASNWIFSAARGETSARNGITPQLNPCLLVAFLEKEQSLLTGQFSGVNLENRLNLAMGYGCPDSSACNPMYKGFVNQLNWAAYQLEFNFILANNPGQVDAYQVNRTIYTLDGLSVFLSNAATAASYRYTPHVYWGNYNLWKIMTSNGWGSSSITYSMSELDAVNLPNKNNILRDQFTNRIKESDVFEILNNPPAMGTISDQVKLLQEFLRQEGYFSYPLITGFYGTVTDSARRAYIADAPKRETITSQCNPLYARSWQLGQSGGDVFSLQECLRSEGVYAWPTITGYFGEVTAQGLNTIRIRKGISQGIDGGRAVNNQFAGKKFRTIPNNSPAVALNLRNGPCGSSIGSVSWGMIGVIHQGQIPQNCFGGTWNWVQISFENGQTGWVASEYLIDTTIASQVKSMPNNTDPLPAGSSNPPSPAQTNQVRYKTNNRGTSAKSLNLRDNICGTQIGNIPWNVEVIQIEGPINQGCFGGTWDWYKVQSSSGQVGWVVGFYLDVVSGNSISGKKYQTIRLNDPSSALNVRVAPCKEVKEQVGWNMEVVQIGPVVKQSCWGQTFDWYPVILANGRSGWVSGNYLKPI